MDGFELNTTHYKPRKGRSLGIILLILILLGATAAGVWFWRQRDIDSLKSQLGAATQTPVQSDNTPVPDISSVTNWNQITVGPMPLANEKLAGFSFRLPPAWTFVSCGNTETVVAYTAPNTQSQTSCGSEQASPVVISAQAGDGRKNYRYSDTASYEEFKSEEVVIGDEEFELNTAQVEKPTEFGPAAGSTITSYVLFDEVQSVTYAASYVKEKDAPQDLTADFKQMLEKTFTLPNVQE
jgi:hypothetical protein